MNFEKGGIFKVFLAQTTDTIDGAFLIVVTVHLIETILAKAFDDVGKGVFGFVVFEERYVAVCLGEKEGSEEKEYVGCLESERK